MTKRFNPDFSLSISHELAYMRETPEGGYVAHGDYATLFSELELVKADRDAQQKRADALAVENAALKASRETLAKNALETCNDVFSAGFRNASLQQGLMESTGNRNLYPNPIKALVDESIRELTTPATSAALAAIRLEAKAEGIEHSAYELEAFAEKSSERVATALKTAAVFLRMFVLPELREAK